MNVYERLGIRRVINADATLTRLGGSLMGTQVLDAMREAAGSFVDMYELQQVVGRRLADLTRNEAAYVSTGAAAGLVLATLAAMTEGDLPTIADLIETGEAPKNEVIIHRAHRIPYDPAIRLAVARIVETGNRLQTFPADLAVFSGGKDFRGPQASGLLVGTDAMIAAVAVNGSPHQRLARPMKVGKEEMIGLLVAVEQYVAEDWQNRVRRYEATVERWVEHFRDVPEMDPSRVFPNEAGQPTPRCRVTFAAEAGLSGAEVARLLWEGDPRIAVAVDGPDAISITPELLEEGEESILLDRIAP